MRVLIVEDDFTSRKLLEKILSPFGEADLAVDGEEGIRLFRRALDSVRPYNLVCLDIMMPGMDGQQVLKMMREMEKDEGIVPKHEVKIIMTTALNSPKDVIAAYYKGGCSSYLVKPIDKKQLLTQLKDYQLID